MICFRYIWITFIVALWATSSPALAEAAQLGAPAAASSLSESAVHNLLLRADGKTLEEIFRYPGDDTSKALAAMALDRVTWHLDQSTKTSEICTEALAKTQPEVAFFCAKFKAGNLRLVGRYADAARVDAASDVKFEALADRDVSFQGFVKDNQIYAAIPKILVERLGDDVVPVHYDPVHGFTTTVLINGDAQTVGLDTGAPTTLTQGTARRLGVQILVKDHGIARGFLGKRSAQSLGLVDLLQIGSIKVRHFPVEVIESGRDVIGNDLLMQFGRFRLTSDTLLLPAGQDALVACQEPMLVSTAAFGGAVLFVKPFIVNGQTRTALLDTGDSFVLNGNASALTDGASGGVRAVHVRDLTRGDSKVEAIQSRVSAIYARGTHDLNISIFPKSYLPYDYILGAGALQRAWLEVDFVRAHVCLVPRV